MPITKRFIATATVLLALAAATLLDTGYLTTPPQVAEGHGGGNYDGTGHAKANTTNKPARPGEPAQGACSPTT